MKTQDVILLILFGALFWLGGTIGFRARGARLLETTPPRYWLSFVLTAVASAGVCVFILLWRQIPPSDWGSATLLIALPGMLGEVMVLARFAAFMPGMQPASAGRYGALLFMAYGLVLCIGEVVTLRAAR